MSVLSRHQTEKYRNKPKEKRNRERNEDRNGRVTLGWGLKWVDVEGVIKSLQPLGTATHF